MAINWSDYYQMGTQFLPKPQNVVDPMQAPNARFTTAVNTNAKNYDDIMGGYRDVLANPISPNVTSGLANKYQTMQPSSYQAKTINLPSMFNPERVNYSASPDVTSALGSLKGLTETGGLSAAEQGDLRARGISPIRAVYANAQRELDRTKRLAGGYSPSYNATAAKMARAMSSQLSDKVSDVNAGIAEMVQRGKLASAPAYASAAQAENSLREQIALSNAEAANRGNMFNIGNEMDTNRFNAGAVNAANQFNAGASNDASRFNAGAANQFMLAMAADDPRLKALSGMTSLYGTTPALANMFGNQALNYAGMNQNQQNIDANRGLNLISGFYGGLR